jgi:hypothetical protein
MGDLLFDHLVFSQIVPILRLHFGCKCNRLSLSVIQGLAQGDDESFVFCRLFHHPARCDSSLHFHGARTSITLLNYFSPYPAGGINMRL